MDNSPSPRTSVTQREDLRVLITEGGDVVLADADADGLVLDAAAAQWLMAIALPTAMTQLRNQAAKPANSAQTSFR